MIKFIKATFKSLSPSTDNIVDDIVEEVKQISKASQHWNKTSALPIFPEIPNSNIKFKHGGRVVRNSERVTMFVPKTFHQPHIKQSTTIHHNDDWHYTTYVADDVGYIIQQILPEFHQYLELEYKEHYHYNEFRHVELFHHCVAFIVANNFANREYLEFQNMHIIERGSTLEGYFPLSTTTEVHFEYVLNSLLTCNEKVSFTVAPSFTNNTGLEIVDNFIKKYSNHPNFK